MRLGLAEVAPAVPAIGALASLFTAVLTFCVVTVIIVLWVQILRKPLIALANVGIVHVHPFGFLHSVVTSVDHWLDAAQKGSERGVTWSFHALMWSLSETYRLTRDLAQAGMNLRNWAVHHTSRHVGAQTAQSISPRIKKLEREYHGIEAELHQLEKKVRSQGAVGAAASPVSVAKLSRGIDRINTKIGHIEHEIAAINHGQTHAGSRTKTKEGTIAIPNTVPRVVPRTRAPASSWHDVLTKTAMAALAVSMLARLKLSWLRCPALGRMGRKIGCGGWLWLEGFFASAFEAMVVLDLCRFALAAQKLARFIVPQLGSALLVQNAVCLGGGASYPSAHDEPKVRTTITLPSAHD